MALNWHGDAVKAKVRAATKTGVNATMAAAGIHAKRHHPWQNRTGILEGSIGIAEYAVDIPGGVRGVWGSQDVAYALILELGSMGVPATRAPTDGRTRRAYPYLRPAADATYGELAARIRAAFEGRT